MTYRNPIIYTAFLWKCDSCGALAEVRVYGDNPAAVTTEALPVGWRRVPEGQMVVCGAEGCRP